MLLKFVKQFFLCSSEYHWIAFKEINHLVNVYVLLFDPFAGTWKLIPSCEQEKIFFILIAGKGWNTGKKRVNVIFLPNGEYALQMTNILSHGKQKIKYLVAFRNLKMPSIVLMSFDIKFLCHSQIQKIFIISWHSSVPCEEDDRLKYFWHLLLLMSITCYPLTRAFQLSFNTWKLTFVIEICFPQLLQKQIVHCAHVKQ